MANPRLTETPIPCLKIRDVTAKKIQNSETEGNSQGLITNAIPRFRD